MTTLRAILTCIRSLSVRGRPARPHPNDVFLVSYPRSGNTWVRTIIANILFPADRIRALSDLDQLVPDLSRGLPPHSGGSMFRVIKTHHAFGTRRYRQEHDYGRVIYVVRHPYDVVRSYYHYLRAINPSEADAAFPTFVRSFVHGAVWPGSWQEHVLSWLAARESRAMLWLRYEDLCDDPVPRVRAIARFLDHAMGRDRAAEVVDASSRERMIELNGKGPLVRRDYDFVRRTERARIDAEEVTPELKAIIDEFCAPALRAAGYEPVEV